MLKLDKKIYITDCANIGYWNYEGWMKKEYANSFNSVSYAMEFAQIVGTNHKLPLVFFKDDKVLIEYSLFGAVYEQQVFPIF